MRQRICQFVVAALAWLLAVALLTTSFLLISSISRTWAPLDYWYAWIGFFLALGGLISGCFAIAMSGALASDVCGDAAMRDRESR